MASRVLVLSAILSYGCADAGVDGEAEVAPSFGAEDGKDEQPEIAAQTVVRNPSSIPGGRAPAAPAAAAPAAAAPAAAAPAATTCTPTESQAIVEALVWANSAVTDAMGKTPTNDPGRWGNWFSATMTQSGLNHVVSTLNDIKNRTLGSEIRCLKNPGTSEFARCNQITVFAFVALRTPVINLCPRFFQQSLMWQINTLVHEAAHLSLDEPDFKPASAKSPDNSVAQAMALAREDLFFALRNASNFAHFVTNDTRM
jgi:hypothetical protein